MPARPARPTLLAIALSSLLAAPGAAQLPPPTVPRGLLRVEGFTGFTTTASRFQDGRDQPLAADFLRDSVGSNLFPTLEPADQLLRRLTGIPTARLDLGATTASQFVSVGPSGFGLAYGLTSRITLFGRVPIVRVKVRSSLGLDSAQSRAGPNPADPVFGTPAGAAAAAQFFAAFDAALNDLEQNLAAGAYDGNPATRALAQHTLAEGRMVRNDLHALMIGAGTASPFLPTAASMEGIAILARVAALQSTLSGPLGIAGFDQTPGLPVRRVSGEEFRSFLTDPAGPIAATLDPPPLTTIGDVEAGAAILLLDRVNEAERTGGLRVSAVGHVRFPTGEVDQPDALFDVGTGSGHPAVDVGLIADLVLPWGGVRLEGGHLVQMARTVERRIAAPASPFPPAGSLALVSRDPGDVTRAAATPFVRLTPAFAILGGVRYHRKGRDQVVLAPGQPEIPGAPVDLLELDTQASWLEWNGGISYRSPSETRDGRRRLPLDAGVTVSGVASASGGRVDRTLSVRGFLRLYLAFP